MTNISAQLQKDYSERKKEIEEYLDFLQQICIANVLIQRESNDAPYRPTILIRQILTANVYLLLYNLVEATIINCGKALENEFSEIPISEISKLSTVFTDCWIKHTAQVNKSNAKDRFDGAKNLYQKLMSNDETIEMKFDFANSGTLTDKKIKELFEDYNISIELPKELKKELFHKRLNNGKGVMESIKDKRCALAHGEISFGDCGKDISFNDVKRITKSTFHYIEFVIEQVENFIDKKEYFKKEDCEHSEEQ